jgi:NCAIR mutase (PurE)-related protein
MNEVAREVRPDRDRGPRIGIEEAVLCEHKSADQLAHILDRAAAEGRSLLLTRLSESQVEALGGGQRVAIDYDALSGTAFFGAVAPPAAPARVAIVTAGSSDARVGREAARTLAYAGEASELVFDVGVAGLWRLLEELERLERMAVVITVAGMDAALVSVIAGLVPGVVVAVPTATGYGVAGGGETALRAALASCSPGVVAVNIDNGYGAACAALRILNALRAGGAVDAR